MSEEKTTSSALQGRYLAEISSGNIRGSSFHGVYLYEDVFEFQGDGTFLFSRKQAVWKGPSQPTPKEDFETIGNGKGRFKVSSAGKVHLEWSQDDDSADVHYLYQILEWKKGKLLEEYLDIKFKKVD